MQKNSDKHPKEESKKTDSIYEGFTFALLFFNNEHKRFISSLYGQFC